MRAVLDQLPVWVQNYGAVVNGITISSGVISLHPFVGGKLVGNWQSDQAGTLTITQRYIASAGGLATVVAVDPSNALQYPIDMEIKSPFLLITWLQGGVASTLNRIYIVATPPAL